MGWTLRLSLVAGVIATVFTAACSAGGSGARTALLPSTGDTLTAPAMDSTDHLYVANDSQIFVFPASASGNVTPTVEISATTGCNLGFTPGVAVDASGKAFALNNGDAVEEFQIQRFTPPKVRFVAQISGNDTGLAQSVNDAVDASGKLYVTNFASITVYAPGAHDDAAPISTISGSNTGLTPPTGGQGPLGIALDKKGAIYTTARFFGPTGGVLVFAPGSNGNVAPAAAISGSSTLLSNPFGIAVDANGNIYVANDSTSGITVYAPGSTGNVAPIRQINGPQTELGDVRALAVDASGKIYAGSVFGGTFWHISVFPPGANGDVAPTAIISTPSLFLTGELALH